MFSTLELVQLAQAQWEQVVKAQKEAEESKDSEFYDLILANYERQMNLWEKVIGMKNAI